MSASSFVLLSPMQGRIQCFGFVGQNGGGKRTWVMGSAGVTTRDSAGAFSALCSLNCRRYFFT